MDAAGVSIVAREAGPLRALRDVARFGRLSVLGFSLLLPVIGAAVVSPDLSFAQLAALAGVALAFHLFGYVSNDVFDLAIDRTQLLRAGSPLVRGLVAPRVALVIALVPVPAAALVHLAVGAPPAAAAVLLAGMGFGLIYNAYGKRMRFPPAADAAQGLAWVALMLYGALATGRAIGPMVGWLAATIFVYVLLVNAFHGGLRDLENDARHGVRSTALYLGARVGPDGRAVPSRFLRAYGWVLQVLLLALGAGCVVANAASLARGSGPVIVALVVALHLTLLALADAALRPDASRRTVIRAGSAHLYLSMGVVFFPFVFFTGGRAALAIVAAWAAPFAIVLPFLGILAWKARPPQTSAAAVALSCLLALAAPGHAAPAARGVSAQEIAATMALEREKGYDILATANGARFTAGVILELARAARERDPARAPLLLDHRDWFESFVGVAGVSRDDAPTWVRIAFDHGEDQYVDYRQENVIAKVVRGRRPRFAVNVMGGWTGPPARYSYEDHVSEPPLRVTRRRMTSYRLVDYGDAILFDEIDGISGRALGGLLGLLFRVIGEGQAVRSFIAIAADQTQVTLTTGKKGPIVITTTATVDPAGRGEKGIPPARPDLEALEERLREPFEAEYVPIRNADPSRWRRTR